MTWKVKKMKRDLTYQIEAPDHGKKIFDFLKGNGYSHAVITQLKKIPESILLNGKWEYMNTLLHDGDILTIHFEEKNGSASIVPTALPLAI